jgi:hypothetical protein
VRDEGAWTQESFQEAQTAVYVAPVEGGAGPYALTPAYLERARTLAAQRIALAGARLANLLNEALK